jgi:hypothetical protein
MTSQGIMANTTLFTRVCVYSFMHYTCFCTSYFNSFYCVSLVSFTCTIPCSAVHSPISLLFICFVSPCSSTTLTIGPTRTLPWFTLLSCLCVWCVLGLFISPNDKGSRSSEVLVNYQTMWHHIPEDSKLHSQWWTQLRTDWSLLLSQMN